ncbi:tyrosine-type recombinase/integrase [Sphingomonas sanguinis]|uniref:tyrosine-type recombinase/integrase n=1 Tax=Sphingomonas sp. LC-1 TaxID=3110957 RepID=UPI0021BB69E3|nr:tyrosine-type recombinase/integrase [Sphingomonas sp. LC-1]MCT8002347.1 tyrosine-type recombinase/integrase [Sphingomonas sp. LC-1]
MPLHKTKNGKAHMVPATDTVVALLDTLNKQAVGGCWFQLDSNIHNDVKAMGHDIGDVGLHILRHTCITRLAFGGMELQRLSMWAGHSDVSIITKQYSHLDASALAGGIIARYPGSFQSRCSSCRTWCGMIATNG